jgi:hypothetical protein
MSIYSLRAVQVAAEIRRKALALTTKEEWEIQDGKSAARRIKILEDIGRRADEARFSDNFFYLERLQRGREKLAQLGEGQHRSADLRIASFVHSLPEFDDVESVGSNLMRATPPPSVEGGVLDDRSNFESKACDEEPGHRKPTQRHRGNPDLVRAHMVDDSSEYGVNNQDEEGFQNLTSSSSQGRRRSTYRSDPKMPKESFAWQSKPVPRARRTRDTVDVGYEPPSQTTGIPYSGARERRLSTASGYPQSQYELPPSAHYPYHAPPHVAGSSHYSVHPLPSHGQSSTPYGYESPSTGCSTRRPSISASTGGAYFSARGPGLARAALPNRPPAHTVRDLNEEFEDLSFYNPRPRRAYPEG